MTPNYVTKLTEPDVADMTVLGSNIIWKLSLTGS